MFIRAACFTLVNAIVPAQAIEGHYRIEGQNPGQSQVYRGEAIVRKLGDTYSVVWQIGSGRQVGTGILTGPVLSVVFQTVGVQGSGVASFAIVDGNVSEGRWTTIGLFAKFGGSGCEEEPSS